VDEAKMPNLLSPALIDAIARNAAPLQALLGLDENIKSSYKQDGAGNEHAPKIFINCNVTININKAAGSRQNNHDSPKSNRIDKIYVKYLNRNQQHCYRVAIR